MKLFMCEPKYFDVIHKDLNIHMMMSRNVNYSKMISQYWNLTRLLAYYDAHIEFIDPVENLVDMVFAANGALIAGKLAILSNFKAQPRIKESIYWKDFLHNVRTVEGYFEGQGDALFSHNSNILWLGYGFRTEHKACDEISEILQNVDAIPLKLINPKFYHLDTCMCILKNDTVMYYPNAFDEESLTKIRSKFLHCIEVSTEDAENFACNAIFLPKNTIIMHSASNNLKNQLNEYNVVETNMSEFLLSGGSAKCCVLYG